MFDDFPIELILFLIAALIGVVKRVADAGKKLREKSRQLEEGRQKETRVRFEDLEAPPQVEQRAPEPQLAPPEHDPLMPPYGDPVDTALGREPAPLPVPVLRRVPVVPPRRREREERPAPVVTAPRRPVVTKAARRALQRKQHAAKRRRADRHGRKDRIVSLLRGSPETVRDAILLREILAPPVALRGRRRF